MEFMHHGASFSVVRLWCLTRPVVDDDDSGDTWAPLEEPRRQMLNFESIHVQVVSCVPTDTRYQLTVLLGLLHVWIATEITLTYYTPLHTPLHTHYTLHYTPFHYTLYYTLNGCVTLVCYNPAIMAVQGRAEGASVVLDSSGCRASARVGVLGPSFSRSTHSGTRGRAGHAHDWPSDGAGARLGARWLF